MPTLIGVPPSPFVRKVRVVLAEKGIDCDFQMQSPFEKTPEFLAMNPLGKVPVYRDGDLVIPDSSVICAYLEKRHPEPALYPKNPGDYARALFLEEYADTELAQKCGAIFFQRFVRAKMLKQQADEAVVEEALDDGLPPCLDWLSRKVDGEFLVGGALSIADVAVATQLQQLHHAGEQVDPSRWPELAAYAAGILARPSFSGYIAEEERMVA